mgnify:FL=1
MIQNYRPISLLCNFAKVLETILHKRIYTSVKQSISPFQHGFMKKRSTTTNLMCFTQDVSEILDDNGQVDVIFTDFQKAFDQIDHFILLKKLRLMGFSNSMVQLFSSYLIGREQRVRYQNHLSKSSVPTSGVPQGSNLGPLLFLIFINDLPNLLLNRKLLFADDLKIYAKITSVDDCLQLQEDINILINWCLRNRLTLNILKCIVMSFTRKLKPIVFTYSMGTSKLKRTDIYKDLGVIYDMKLSFVNHIQDTVAKAFKTYGFIYRNCKEFTNIRSLSALYYSLVRSRLEYCACVWSPIYEIHIIHVESVQRKFLKFLSFIVDRTYPPRGTDHTLLLERFQFTSLKIRRISYGISFLWKLLNNRVDCTSLLQKINFLVPRTQHTRQVFTFYTHPCRTNILCKSPLHVICNNFNKIAWNCDIHHDAITKIRHCIVTYWDNGS